MLVVAGLSLKNLHPYAWNTDSPYHLPGLKAAMVSYADFDRMPARRQAAMDLGLRGVLGIPEGIQIYLDNGAFYFLGRGGERDVSAYEKFVVKAKPDWYPIPQDFIPHPKMTPEEQRACLTSTMDMNRRYPEGGYVPVVHVSSVLDDYVESIQSDEQLTAKAHLGIGGIVPNFLRMPKARPYKEVLDGIGRVRKTFADKKLHLFGVGGTATLHVAALLGMDSVDSSGWRNRAARGMIQLPGTGERLLVQMGSWRGRALNDAESTVLDACRCPACQLHGREGLLAKKLAGFCNRATHNLWTILEEARLIEEHLQAGTYREWYRQHLDNTVYLPLIERLVEAGAADRNQQPSIGSATDNHA